MSRRIEQRRIGGTDARVSSLGIGTASLGDVFGGVSEGAAREVLQAGLAAGVTYFDTAPLYGCGLAERRLGAALADAGPVEVVLSTKVGRTLDSTEPEGWRFDFSRDAILRGFEASLQRLGRDRVDIVYLHDPDQHADDVYREGWAAAESLKEQGLTRAIGFGMNQWQLPTEFVERLPVDVVMIAGRWTLLDDSAGERLLPLCAERGVAVVGAGVFNSGILVDPADGAWFDYHPATPELLERARAMRALAEGYGERLPSAAIDFMARTPAVTTTVVGCGSARTVAANVAAFERGVPDALMAELQALPVAGWYR